MGANPKNKGKYFENRVSKIIRDTFNLREHECKRAAESGNDKFEYSDILFNDFEAYPMVLECKFHESWNHQGMFPTLNKIFLDWYTQLDIAVSKYKEYYKSKPILEAVVFSKAYNPIYAITSKMYPISRISYKHTYNINDIERNLFIYDFNELIEHMKLHI